MKVGGKYWLQKFIPAGKLECQLTMETTIKGEVILASRTQDLSVTVRNDDPEVVVDVDMEKIEVSIIEIIDANVMLNFCLVFRV